ncbi:hypothetical protein B0I27_11741, partial [Arcticibacter pallidicorallinus]
STAFSPAALVAAWQEPGLIPLGQTTRGLVEERPGREFVDYAGNWLLAGLQNRIEQKARAGTAEQLAEQLRKSRPERRQPVEDDHPKIVRGKRVKF